MRRALPPLLVALVASGCVRGGDDVPSPAAPPLLAAPAVAPPEPVALARWRYRAGDGDWSKGFPGGRVVALPHAANPGPVQGERGARTQAGGVGWYAKEVDVPLGGRHVLRLEGAHFVATVWVDGRLLGTHAGAYEPFAFRTGLREGRHRIVVRVDWRDPAGQTAAGFRRLWFNHGGLQGRVTLTRLSRSELASPEVRTTLRGGAAEVRVRVRVRNASRARTLAVTGRLRRGGRTVPLRFAPVRLGRRRAATVEARALVRDPALWSPGAPALWDLEARVGREALLRRRVGLRELRWDGGRLRLNGRPLRLRGASLPPNVAGRGEALRAPQRAAIVRDLRAVGANATRSQRPLDEAMLDALDAAGILVWLEVAPFEPATAWSARTPPQQAEARRRTLGAVRRARAHPSVLAWSLSNEAAGQGHPAGQAAWIDATARAIKRLDPTRPVAADLWGKALPDAPGLLHRSLDAIGVTDYQGWYEGPYDPPAVQEANARARVLEAQRLFPRKVLVVTEFGAGGARGVPGLGGEREQAALLRRRIGTFRAIRGLDGAIVWTLRDFALRPDFDGGSIRRVAPAVPPANGLLDKGLFRFDGSAKPAAGAVREAFGG